MAKLNISAKSVLGKNFDTPAPVPVLLVSVTDENGVGVENLPQASFLVKRLEFVAGYNLPDLEIIRFTERKDIPPNGLNKTDGIYLMELYPTIVPDVDDTIPPGTILAIRVQQFGLVEKLIEQIGEPPILVGVEVVVSEGWTTTIVQATDSRF